MKLKHFFGEHKFFYLFLIIYLVYLLLAVNPSHLDSDEASYAMTAVFFNRLITDYVSHPTLDPSALYDYATAYYVRYPKFMFLNGPFLHLINALLFLALPYSILLMKLVVVIFSIATAILIYHVSLLIFNREANKKELALLSALLTVTSRFYVLSSITVMLEIPSLFFFILGMYFYYKKRGLLSGLSFGISILTKDVSLPYVLIFSLIAFKDLKKKKRWFYLLGLFLLLAPYVALIVASGSYTLFLDYPRKQTYYIELQGDPQWYELSGWLYYWYIIAFNYSWVALPFLFIGMYYARRRYKSLLLFILLSFLVVTVMSDKAERRVINSVIFLSPMIALAASRIYNRLKADKAKIVTLFLVMLLFILQMPLVFSKPSVPMSLVAQELIASCPDCTVLIASETGQAYSSFLMYEALIRDNTGALRFIRPTVFDSMDVLEVVNNEYVNRIVVIGDEAFINNDPEIKAYLGHVQFIINRYDLVAVYNSSVVGQIRIYDTGITDSKAPPLCVASPSIGKSFCTDFASPIDAL